MEITRDNAEELQLKLAALNNKVAKFKFQYMHTAEVLTNELLKDYSGMRMFQDIIRANLNILNGIAERRINILDFKKLWISLKAAHGLIIDASDQEFQELIWAYDLIDSGISDNTTLLQFADADFVIQVKLFRIDDRARRVQ